MTAILSLLISLSIVLVTSESLALAPLRLLVQAGDEITIKGFQGNVEYIPKDGATDLVVQVSRSNMNSEKQEVAADEWQFTMKRKDGRIQIQVESPQSKQAWSEILMTGAAQPRFDLKIVGPSLPMKVNWQQGSFKTSKFNNTLHVNLLKGRTEILGGEGELRVDSQSGFVKVLNRKGNVEVETYDGKVEISGIEGDVAVDNFVGDSQVVAVDGGLKLLSYKGKTTASKVKGRLEFKNGNSPLHIDNLQGELRGKTMQGPVFAAINGEANVRVESEEGQISLRLPASGAWVNLGTEEGALRVPNFLKLTRLPRQQIRTGRLRGSVGGSVFVRTTSGDIKLR